MSKKTDVRIGDLVIDDELTALRPINPVMVSQYRQNYRAGCLFPPLIVEAETLRVVSGNHRLTAMLAEFGEEYKTGVMLATFKTEADVLKAFVQANLKHGMPLSGASKSAIMQRMVAMDVPVEEISKLFGLAVRRIEERCGMTVLVIGRHKKKTMRPRKRGLETGGEPVTEAQYEDHWSKDRGVPAMQQIEQLSRWVENGWISHDSQTRNAMATLHAIIGTYLETACEEDVA